MGVCKINWVSIHGSTVIKYWTGISELPVTKKISDSYCHHITYNCRTLKKSLKESSGFKYNSKCLKYSYTVKSFKRCDTYNIWDAREGFCVS